jgi:hypothetical protein
MLARKRKRLVPRRQPDGRVAQAPRDDVMGVVKAQRLRLVKEAHVMDQGAENPLGVYRIKGIILQHHEDAGRQYAALVASVKRDMNSPSEDAQNRILGNMQPSDGREVVPLRTDDEIREGRLKRSRRYDAAMVALWAHGPSTVHAVNTVALRERSVADDQVPKLRNGLEALARHFKLLDR